MIDKIDITVCHGQLNMSLSHKQCISFTKTITVCVYCIYHKLQVV